MHSHFRRQLLALGQLDGNQEQIDLACTHFIEAVQTAHISERPDTEAVLDILLADHVLPATAERFTRMFEAAVWHAA